MQELMQAQIQPDLAEVNATVGRAEVAVTFAFNKQQQQIFTGVLTEFKKMV